MIEIRKFSECEFTPNILYEIVKNETKYYKYLHIGGYIRAPNCSCTPHTLVGAYWENYGDKNEKFIHIIEHSNEPDWADKIYVKYDKEYVYKTLYNNAEFEYNQHMEKANFYKQRMKNYKKILNKYEKENQK